MQFYCPHGEIHFAAIRTQQNIKHMCVRLLRCSQLWKQLWVSWELALLWELACLCYGTLCVETFFFFCKVNQFRWVPDCVCWKLFCGWNLTVFPKGSCFALGTRLVRVWESVLQWEAVSAKVTWLFCADGTFFLLWKLVRFWFEPHCFSLRSRLFFFWGGGGGEGGCLSCYAWNIDCFCYGILPFCHVFTADRNLTFLLWDFDCIWYWNFTVFAMETWLCFFWLSELDRLCYRLEARSPLYNSLCSRIFFLTRVVL